MCSAVANAQAPVLWQVRGGPTYTQVSDPLGTGNGAHTGRAAEGMGCHLGVAVEPLGGRALRLRLEALADLRVSGYRFDQQMGVTPLPGESPPNAYGVRRVRTGWLDLPVLLSIHHWKGLRLEAGGACSVLLQAEERSFGKQAGPGEEDFDGRRAMTDEIAPVEWAGVLGVEVESGGGLSAGLRLHNGFTDLDRAPGTSPSFARTWQFSLSYTLRKAPALHEGAGRPTPHRSRS